MKNIMHSGTDPFFNLAMEEYLLRNKSYDLFMLWCSKASIVVGKHQNTLSEINFPYVYLQEIDVARRLSGGGTVFHGPGNLNFTFIRNGEPGKLIDFQKHTAPVIAFLNEIGVPASFEGKNDLRVDGLKISGNAEHVYKNRVLHHGTLLYNADLRKLTDAIRVQPGRYEDKSVQSVRSKVANISSFLDDPPEFAAFQQMLETWLKTYFADEKHISPVTDVSLNAAELEAVRRMADAKYRQWDWNYAYSPDYRFSGSARLNGQDVNLKLFVSKGIIKEVLISGVDDDIRWHAFSTELQGCRHHPPDIRQQLQHHGLLESKTETFPQEMMELFF